MMFVSMCSFLVIVTAKVVTGCFFKDQVCIISYSDFISRYVVKSTFLVHLSEKHDSVNKTSCSWIQIPAVNAALCSRFHRFKADFRMFLGQTYGQTMRIPAFMSSKCIPSVV